MAGDDTMPPDQLFNNVLRREEPDGGAPNPGGSVSNAASVSLSPPGTAAASNNNKRRPSSAIEKLTGGAATENNGGESPSALKVEKKASDFFPDKVYVTDALRTVLARLDASDLTLVYEKHNMPASDRSKDQHRLLMSCKCEIKRAAFASIFTEAEMTLVHQPQPQPEPEPPSLKATTEGDESKHGSKDKSKGKGKGKGKKKQDGGGEEQDKSNNKKGCCCNNDKANDGKEDNDGEEGKQQRSTVQGLAVEAYACDGRAYELNLKYLSCNTGYRIIGHDWTVFLENNGLLVGGGGGVTRKRRSRGGQRKKQRRSSLPEEKPISAVDDVEQQPAVAVRDAAADDVQMELWAFRSPKLSVGVIDQPEGALGLLLLHYRGGGGAQAQGATEEVQVQVAAPQDQEVGGGQPQQHNRHGTATQVAAGDCAGVEVDAATVVVDVVDDAAGEAAARSTRDMPLTAEENLAAVWLSFRDNRGD